MTHIPINPDPKLFKIRLNPTINPTNQPKQIQIHSKRPTPFPPIHTALEVGDESCLGIAWLHVCIYTDAGWASVQLFLEVLNFVFLHNHFGGFTGVVWIGLLDCLISFIYYLPYLPGWEIGVIICVLYIWFALNHLVVSYFQVVLCVGSPDAGHQTTTMASPSWHQFGARPGMALAMIPAAGKPPSIQ